MGPKAEMEALMKQDKQLATVWLAVALWFAMFVFSSAATASVRAVVVSGIGGNAEFAAAFTQQTDDIAQALRTITRTDEDVHLLQDAQATREGILNAISDVVKDAQQSQGTEDEVTTFVLVLVGHGNVNREGYQYNVPGPDLSVTDLLSALAPLPMDEQLVVASTSASGALLTPLKQPGRTLITATKSAGELNAVRFSEYFAEALATDAADVDRNELLTVREAFTFANTATQDYFEEQKLLASEHARLAGADSNVFTLATLGALKEARNNPVVAGLLTERSALEADFYALRARKAQFNETDYYQQLEAVLIQIAQLQGRIDQAVNANTGAE